MSISIPSTNSARVSTTTNIRQLTGASFPGLPDITQWIFPENFSQSTLGGRTGSNACTFIALYFGHLYSHYNLPAPQGYQLSEQWMFALHEAIIKGNEIHDELFEGEASDVSVEDAVEMAGIECWVQSIGQNFDLIGFDCQNQLEDVFDSLTAPPLLHPKCNVVVTGGKSMLLVVNADGSTMIVDSHRHDSMGAIIAYCASGQSRTLAKWLGTIHRIYWQQDLRLCSVIPVYYR